MTNCRTFRDPIFTNYNFFPILHFLCDNQSIQKLLDTFLLDIMKNVSIEREVLKKETEKRIEKRNENRK